MHARCRQIIDVRSGDRPMQPLNHNNLLPIAFLVMSGRRQSITICVPLESPRALTGGSKELAMG
jgi:hypothetical protein